MIVIIAVNDCDNDAFNVNGENVDDIGGKWNAEEQATSCCLFCQPHLHHLLFVYRNSPAFASVYLLISKHCHGYTIFTIHHKALLHRKVVSVQVLLWGQRLSKSWTSIHKMGYLSAKNTSQNPQVNYLNDGVSMVRVQLKLISFIQHTSFLRMNGRLSENRSNLVAPQMSQYISAHLVVRKESCWHAWLKYFKPWHPPKFNILLRSSSWSDVNYPTLGLL